MVDRSLNYGREAMRRFLSQCGPYKTVLDLGAGGGQDLSLAREARPQAKLYALEAYPPYVRMLEAKGVQVFRKDIEKDRIPLKDGQADVVILNQVLEHVKEVFWVLHEVSRVLAPGGRLLLGVPNMAALHNRLLLPLGIQPTQCKTNSAHVRGFTKGDLLQFLESGAPGCYKLVDFTGANFYPFPPFLAKPLAGLFPSLAWGIFLHLEKKGPYKSGFIDYPRAQKLETNFFLGAR